MGGVMSKSNQLICCSLTALIVAALSYGPAVAQDMFTFMRPPVLSQPVPQATEDQQADENENAQLPARLQKQIVAYPTREAADTIIIDTQNTFLYYVLGNGKAIRYGIGVGRQGFTWSGVKSIIRKTEWPDWYPPGCYAPKYNIHLASHPTSVELHKGAPSPKPPLSHPEAVDAPPAWRPQFFLHR
jgi:lipoprotein-anchoring transpeptidase ErfK/SrfK